jgi:hypothetical protein
LPESVRRFIAAYVPSATALEILLLLADRPGGTVAVREAAMTLRRSVPHVEQVHRQLVVRGAVSPDGTDGYVLAPKLRDDPAYRWLHRNVATHRVAVMAEVYSAAP